MNHLGGKWLCKGYVEWFPGFTVELHLWMATQEQRDQCFLQVKIASSAATWYNGSALTK